MSDSGGNNLFRPEAVREQARTLRGTVFVLPPVPLAFLALLLAVALVAGGVFVVWGKYARTASAEGFLVPEAGITNVRSQTPGLVAALPVSEGERVEAGDVLVRIANRQRGVASAALMPRLDELADERKRLLEGRAEAQARRAAAERRRIEAQRRALAEQRDDLAGELALQDERIALAEKRLDRLEALRADGNVSAGRVTEARDGLLQARQRKRELIRRRGEIERERAELAQQLDAVQARAEARQAEIGESLAAVEQDRLDERRRLENVIRAPHAGRVTTIQVSPNQEVDREVTLMRLSPGDGDLRAHLVVPSEAVGEMAAGQTVRLRYDAFPHQEYGTYTGTIESVSAGVVERDQLLLAPPRDRQDPRGPSYLVKVALDRQSVAGGDGPLPLRAGMSVAAEIVFERRRLYRWITEPLEIGGGGP